MKVTTLRDDRLRTTSLCLSVAYGARTDPDGALGLAHFLEHLLMSAPARGGLPVAERVERRGGQANATTALEKMLFYAQVHPADAQETLQDLLAAVLHPTFTRDIVASERKVVLQEIAAEDADPSSVVQDAFLTALFPGHPLGRPIGGSPAHLEAMEIGAIVTGHRDSFRRRRMELFVIGPGADELVVPPVAYGGDDAFADPPVPLTSLPDRTDPLWPDEFCWVSVGGRSPAAGDDRDPAFTVLSHLFGSSPSSPMYRAMRGADGLAYAFQSWNRAYREAGAWRVFLGADKDSAPAAAAAAVALLERMAEKGPERDDLLAAKRQAEMQILLALEDPLERVKLAADHAHSGPWSAEREQAAIDAVTSQDVRAAAEQICAGLVTVVRS